MKNVEEWNYKQVKRRRNNQMPKAKDILIKLKMQTQTKVQTTIRKVK